MLVTIKRSEEYVKAQRIATAQNVPDIIKVDIDPAALSEQTRRTLIEWWGSYPDNLDCVGYDSAWALSPQYKGWGLFRLEHDGEAETVTPEVIDGLIAPIPARIEAKKQEYRAAEAAALARLEEEERLERERREAQNPIIDVFLADPSARPTRLDSCPYYWIEIAGEKIDNKHPRWTELRDEQARRAEIDERAKYAERDAWIAAHGSDRLKRLLAEGIECGGVYQEERLALERPWWEWGQNLRGEAKAPRNARQEGLDLLDEARKTDPGAKLVWWVTEHEHDACEYGDDCPKYDWRGYACTSTFLGEDIVYGVPDEFAS